MLKKNYSFDFMFDDSRPLKKIFTYSILWVFYYSDSLLISCMMYVFYSSETGSHIDFKRLTTCLVFLKHSYIICNERLWMQYMFFKSNNQSSWNLTTTSQMGIGETKDEFLVWVQIKLLSKVMVNKWFTYIRFCIFLGLKNDCRTI